MSIHRQIGVGSILRVLALATSTGIALRLTPFVVHILGDRNYGLWTLVSTVGTYYALLDLGLSSAVTRHIAGALGNREKQEVNRIASTALAMYLVVGVLVFVASAIVASLSACFLHTPAEIGIFRRLVLIAGASTGLTVPVRVFVGLLNANLRFDISAGLDIMAVLLRAILTYLSLKAGSGIMALAWIVLAVALVSLAGTVACSYRVVSTLRLNVDHFQWDVAKRLISYGSISLAAQLADLLRFQVDALVVAGFIGVAAVTHYNIAGALAQYFISLMLAATGFLGPIFSRLQAANDSKRMRETLHLGSKVSVALANFVCFGLLAWGRPFIVCWMGTPYLDAYPPLAALALGLTVALWQTSSLQLLYGTSKHGIFAIFNSAEGLANLILSLLLVHRFGLLGVALGTMIPMLITKLLVQPWYVCRTTGLSVIEYYGVLGKTLTRTIAALLLPAGLTLHFSEPKLGALLWLAMASLCCFVPVVYFFVFNRAERELIGSIMPIRLSQSGRSTAIAEAVK